MAVTEFHFLINEKIIYKLNLIDILVKHIEKSIKIINSKQNKRFINILYIYIYFKKSINTSNFFKNQTFSKHIFIV